MYKKEWCKWLADPFRLWQLEVEWDGKASGQGSCNVGVPQGSPFSLVVFFILMAPVLEGIEKRMKEEAGGGGGGGAGRVRQNQGNVNVEVPSFVDDMCIDIVDWEGGCNMQKEVVNFKRIVREVEEECRLPLETDKMEVLELGKNRKKKIADWKYVKWLGVILSTLIYIGYLG